MYRLYVIAQVSPPSELHEGVEQAKEKPQNAPDNPQPEDRDLSAPDTPQRTKPFDVPTSPTGT